MKLDDRLKYLHVGVRYPWVEITLKKNEPGKIVFGAPTSPPPAVIAPHAKIVSHGYVTRKK